MTQPTIRWGILGPGGISKSFAVGLRDAAGAELVAVGSRSQERADAFAAEFSVPRAYAGYDRLVQDSEVDVIYIGTPHSFHKEHAVLCLQQGKHVLCEKPLAINAREAAEMIAAARREKRVLLEAMWTRFLPTLAAVRDNLAAGAIGQPRMITADFGFRSDFDPQSRLFDPSLGGGALLDVGIYPLSLASMIFGRPVHISSRANLGITGIDEEAAAVLGYARGQMAVLTTAVRLDTPQEAFILGTAGWIKIHSPWWASAKVTIKEQNGEEQTLHLPFKGNGYTHEAEAIMDLIRTGRLESEVMPLDESLAIMQTMDEIRRQWGLKYPME